MPESDESANAQIRGSPASDTVSDPVTISDVFVSYASQDRALATAVVAALEREGLKCWIAPRDVTPGVLYADEIIRAINGTRVLVLILSISAIASPHIGREVERACSKRRPIVTLRTDAAQLTTALEYFLSESQWIDLGTDGTRDALAKLVTAVRHQLAPASTIPPAASSSVRTRARRRPSWLPVAALVVVGVALAWFVIDKVRSSRYIESANNTAAVPLAAPAAFAPPPHSVAVLPFTNLSGDPKQEYFSDGLSEELINALTNIESLRVIARTSSFSFKDKNVDIGTVARKLNVAAVLEGSVRRSGKTVRVTVQLVDAINGFHLWSQDYDRDLRDVLQLQSEIAASVAQQLRARLMPEDTEKIEAGGTQVPEAYDAYLSAQQLATAADTDAEYKTALHAADQAIALDPNYAAAYALRARLLRDTTFSESDPVKIRRSFDLARQAADRAVVLAPNFADGHLILGWHVLAHGFLDLTGAAREIHRGVELAPGSAMAQDYWAGLESVLDHRESAVSAMRRAVNLDPQNYNFRHHLVSTLYFTRRFAQVPDAVRDADALKPASHSLGSFLVLSYLGLGQADRARQACGSAATPLDDNDRHFCLTLAYGTLQDLPRADVELEKLKALDGLDAPAFQYAEIYAQRGDKSSALHWLARAEAAREERLTSLRSDWLLDPIRNEPKFKALEARMNFPP